MEILEERQKPETRVVDFLANERMPDERDLITLKKYEKILRKYFRDDRTSIQFLFKEWSGSHS